MLNRGWRVVVAVFCGFAGACGGPSDPSSTIQRLNAPPPGQSAADRPFVVFSARRVVIPRVGVPVPIPVSVGSLPSRETLESMNPSVVQVDQAGALVGMAAGIAQVRTRGGEGGVLEVEVRPAFEVEIVPHVLELPAGGTGRFELVEASTRQPLPADAGDWMSDAPRRAAVHAGAVRAGDEPGHVAIRARYGEAIATAEVRVAGESALSITPPKALMHIGAVRAFQAFGTRGPVSAEWNGEGAGFVTVQRDGLVMARRPGTASVCARTPSGRACARVEVVP